MPLTTDTHAPPTRRMVALAALAAVAGAVVVGTLRGAASAVLWLAFAALAAAVMLFWETLRLVLDPQAPGDATDDDEATATEALSARKRSALRALKELEFERSLGRISEEDFQGLSTRYRAEARDAMAALDAGLGRWRDDAATLLERAAQEALAPAEVHGQAHGQAHGQVHGDHRRGPEARHPRVPPVHDAQRPRRRVLQEVRHPHGDRAHARGGDRDCDRDRDRDRD